MLRYIADRLPYVGNLRKQIKSQGLYPLGHYYSPIPTSEDVLSHLKTTKEDEVEMTDISLKKDNQFALLQKYQEYYSDLPFPERKNEDYRFYYDNIWFSYSDAVFLYSFLRDIKPKRIIEVGSGFSSAVILDTTERFFSEQPQITFVEPYPERLNSLLKPQDKKNTRIIEKKVQELPIETFTSLEAGDLLFIDSSHVVKYGSDLQFLLFNVIPKLPAGVFVHFHDVFYPFEYPEEWLLEGRYWNENYFLRAFLAYNNEWSIYFFNNYVTKVFADFVAEKMPLCSKNQGGSLYIQKAEKN